MLKSHRESSRPPAFNLVLITTMLAFVSVCSGLGAAGIDKGRILFISHFDTNTEINMMLEIAGSLVHRGYECHFLAWEHFRQKIESRGYSFSLIQYPKEAPADFELTDLYESKNARQYIGAFNGLGGLLASTYEPAIQSIKNSMESRKPDMIVSSMFSLAAIDLARLNDIPLSIIFASPLGHLFFYEDTAAAPDSFLWGRPESSASFEARMRKLMRNVMIMSGDTSGSSMNAVRKLNGIPTYHDPLTNWGRASIIVPNTLSLDVARRLRPLTHMVGFVTSMPSIDSYSSEEHVGLRSWLDSRPAGVVYAAFGSLYALPRKEFHILVQAMAAWVDRRGGLDKAGAMIILKDGHDFDLSRVPQSVNISGWTNQKLVLSHPNLAVFITHGGLGSLSEAITAGVPMLALPAFGDQMYNAIMLERAGVALQIHRRETPVTSNAIGEHLERLSTDPSFKQALAKQKLISDFAGGTEKAADVIEQHILVGIDHLVPLEEQVSFLSATNLDVYVAAAAAILLIIKFASAIVVGTFKSAVWIAVSRKRAPAVTHVEHSSSASSLHGSKKDSDSASKFTLKEE